MKQQTISLIFVLFLTACTPAAQASTPTSTPLPTSTSTPTPPPTVTPTSTPEAWVAIAEEHDIPPEQAKKLEGMNVTFEQWNKNVDGVLVKNKAGQDVFWYDPQTEFLVAVDRWPRIYDVASFKENKMTQAELYSEEYFAWLKYISSTIEFDPEKIKDVKMAYYAAMGISEIGWNASTAPNFEIPGTAPFERNPGGLGFVRPENAVGSLTDYAILPLIMYDKTTQKAYPIKVVLRSSPDTLQMRLEVWRDKMNITFLVASPASKFPEGAQVDVLVDPTWKTIGEDEMNRRFGSFVEGNYAELSDSRIVVLAFEEEYKGHR